MKKHAEPLCALVCTLLTGLFVAIFSYAAVHYSLSMIPSVGNAYYELPWK